MATGESGGVRESLLFTRGQGGIFTDVFYNTWRTSGNVHFDVNSGELVYGPASDKTRELIKYSTMIDAEGLMDPEFLTKTPASGRTRSCTWPTPPSPPPTGPPTSST